MEANITASQKPSVGSLAAALSILLVGGGLVGLAAGLVGSFFYLAILFPIGMGFAGILVAEKAARAGRIREKTRVLALFALTALVVYGSFHYGRYLMFQLGSWRALASSDVAQSAGGEIDPGVAKVFIDYALQKETGHTGFLGYMLLRAKEGFSVGRFYSENRLELSGALAWLYWLAELGLILWIMKGGVQNYLDTPVCESCGRRLGREKHLGGTSPANEPLLLDLLQRHDMNGLGELLVRDAGLPSVELYMRKCESCGQSASVITVRRARQGAKGVVLAEISKATLPPQEGTRFLQQLSFEVDS